MGAADQSAVRKRDIDVTKAANANVNWEALFVSSVSESRRHASSVTSFVAVRIRRRQRPRRSA
jgi:hypothetical protein